jgi:biopolymer transport protein ExbD
MTFSAFNIPRGLPVGVLEPGGQAAREEYYTDDPIVIVVAISENDYACLSVDSKKVRWGDFGTTVRAKLQLGSQRVAYVEAESNVRWSDVVDVIDIVEGLGGRVVLSTITPDVKSLRGDPQELGNRH